MLVSTVVLAGPSKLPYDGLFHAKASWRLACDYGTPEQLVAHGELTCVVDDVAKAGGSKRAHVTCDGQDDVLGDIHEWALEPRTLVATERGLWSVDDHGPDGKCGDLAHITDQPPLLSARPSAGKRRRDDDPSGHAGMWFVTSALDRSWCVGKMPWGWGGGTHVWVTCFSPGGAITGVAGMKRESSTIELRCGHVPDPQAVLDAIQH